jgi:hypothetical protein
LLMLLLSNTSDAQGDFGLDLEVSQPEGGVIFGCSCIPLSFTLSNIEDDPNTVTLDLQTLIGRYEFCDNPGFVLMPAPGTNQQIGTVDVWRMTGITLAPYELRTITASIRVISFITDLDPSIASTATNGVVTEGPTNAFTVGFDHSFVTIGVDQNSVTSLQAIANGASGNLLPPPAGPGQDILLNGELVVDVNETYTFGGGSHLNLGPNAKISVLDGNALQLISTTKIRSCGQTWNTIEIMNGGTLVIDRAQGNQSCTPCELEIRDGEVAVTARNGSTVQINGAKFRNNGVGVRVPNDVAVNNISLNVTNNLFEENGPSLLPGFAGLDLNDLYVAVIGRNTYKNMNYGIYGTNTNLFTLYDEFSDLDFAGIAMIGNGHFLYQVGKGNSLATPTFSNVITGVRTLGMSVYITENGMSGVTSGVRAYMLNNKDAFVFDNTIAARNNGILVSSLRPLNYSTIENNTITMDGNADGRGINSISTNIGAAPYVRINGNTINLFNATYGVDMMANRGVEARATISPSATRRRALAWRWAVAARTTCPATT